MFTPNFLSSQTYAELVNLESQLQVGSAKYTQIQGELVKRDQTVTLDEVMETGVDLSDNTQKGKIHMNTQFVILQHMATGFYGCSKPIAYFDTFEDAQTRLEQLITIDAEWDYYPTIQYSIIVLSDNTQKGTSIMNNLISVALFMDNNSILYMTYNGYQSKVVNPDLIDVIIEDSNITKMECGNSYLVDLPDSWINSLTWRPST